MPFCRLCWLDVGNIIHHQMYCSTHLRGDAFKCNDCSQWFSSKKGRSRHRLSTGCADPFTSQFRCCDCDLDFKSQSSLNSHLRNKILHPPRVVIALAPSAAYCEKCNKVFKHAGALGQHLASVIHNPIMKGITCLGGKGCEKTFCTPSGMLAHLESGACASGLTRRMIDDLVIANDPTNIITDPVAVEIVIQNRMAITSSSYSSSVGGSIMFTPSETSGAFSDAGSGTWNDIFTNDSNRNETATHEDWSSIFDLGDSESDSEGLQFTSSGTTTPTLERSTSSIFGYSPTPSFSNSYGTGVFLTSSSSSSEIFTPSGASLSSQLIPNYHLRSQIHAPKIYRCPSPSLVLGSAHQSTGKQRKSFAALSSLAQHVEAGACEGGKQTFDVAISLVNEKLKSVGVKNLTLV